MHTNNLAPWQYSHASHDEDRKREHSTRRVTLLTAVMMVIEISAGTLEHVAFVRAAFTVLRIDLATAGRHGVK